MVSKLGLSPKNVFEGFEFLVIEVSKERILLSDETGQLYEINAVPDGMGESYLQYYRMEAEVLLEGE
jgi:hypothetical protein